MLFRQLKIDGPFQFTFVNLSLSVRSFELFGRFEKKNRRRWNGPFSTLSSFRDNFRLSSPLKWRAGNLSKFPIRYRHRFSIKVGKRDVNRFFHQKNSLFQFKYMMVIGIIIIKWSAPIFKFHTTSFTFTGLSLTVEWLLQSVDWILLLKYSIFHQHLFKQFESHYWTMI